MSAVPPEAALAALPGPLPAGERVLWAARPDAPALERGLFRRRLVLGLAAILACWPVLSALDAGMSPLAALPGALLFAPFVVPVLIAMRLLSRLAARHALYVLTDRRIVLQVGYVYTRTVNLPLSRVRDVSLRPIGRNAGDLMISVAPGTGLSYAVLMPHARLLRLLHPTPVLRAMARDDLDAVIPLLTALVRPDRAARGAWAGEGAALPGDGLPT